MPNGGASKDVEEFAERQRLGLVVAKIEGQNGGENAGRNQFVLGTICQPLRPKADCLGCGCEAGVPSAFVLCRGSLTVTWREREAGRAMSRTSLTWRQSIERGVRRWRKSTKLVDD